ncbi:MAG: hypothetical protein J7518_15905 [Nocardioidaceae bacterium]|nr:hypothetical protein [Nocardioidaceae bacterium]
MNDQITRTLAEKAERFSQQHHSDLSVEGVLARAGEIRRGRRMRATMAMAAVVLAVAVPVGITVMNQDPEAKGPVPAPPVDHRTIGLGDLSTGKQPFATGFLVPGDPKGTIMVRSPRREDDGRQTAIDAHLDGNPASTITDLAFVQNGFIVAYTNGDDGTRTAVFWGDDSTEPQKWALESGFAVSPEKNVVAFAMPGGTIVAVQDGGSRWYEIGKVPGSGLNVTAVWGENCSGRSAGRGCAVYVQRSDEKPATYQVTDLGQVAKVGTFLSLAAVREDAFAGIVSATDTGSCSDLRTAEDKKVWGTCDYRLRSFSPDGKHLLATGAYGDGFGDTQLAILDAANGTPALDLRTVQDAAITQMIWEDDEHVLATVFQKNQWAVLRIGLDGHREYALGPVAGTDMEPPLELPVR